jgi:hypothetical protein
MKIVSLGTELLHTSGQAEKYDEANSRISQFFESA